MRELACDIAIIGGSLGGCAAAMNALHPPSDGLHVCLVAAEAWLGGQISAQGVAPLDEHPYIETFGATGRYMAFRDAVREYYHRHHDAPLIMPDSVLGPDMPLNPGNGWVSRLCYTPQVGRDTLTAMLPDSLEILQGFRPVAAERDGDRVTAVLCTDDTGDQVRITCGMVLDATDLGDLLPLTGTPYVTGAEWQAQTGESHAAPQAQPGETQGFTYCFAVEYCPGEDHTIEPPAGYAAFRDHQPYTLSPLGRDGQPVVYRMFTTSEQGNLPFWTYRRIHDGALLGGRDIALINWISNDYHGGNIIDTSPEDRARYLDEAKRLSLGFLYWLQTACPRDEGGIGYPELKLRPDIMGTADGLSQQPYIRESRRVQGLTRIVEQDISAESQTGARARHYADSVGIGWYAMDLHPCVGNLSVSMYAPTRPFQIPLGALVPQGTDNLLAACKNIATTHLTNGAYRLQPVEWAIGEAAGAVAAFCLENGLSPQALHADPWQVWRLQYRLVAQGCPIVWAVDVPVDHAAFVPSQLLLVRGLIVPGSLRWNRLEIGMDDPLGDSIDLAALRRLAVEIGTHTGAPLPVEAIDAAMTWAQVCALFADPLREALA